jgi:hypothetical protein
MFDPSGEELDEVRESFGLHELAVEDAKTFHLHPKVEERETGVHPAHRLDVGLLGPRSTGLRLEEVQQIGS